MAFPRRIKWPVMVAVVILGLVMAWKGRGIQNKPQVLPDGTVLTLLQVDYGKTNVLYGGSWVQRTFRKRIPYQGLGIGPFRLMPPHVVASIGSGNNQLVFWTRPNGGPAFSFDYLDPGDWNQFHKALAFDENGNQYEVDVGSVFGSSASDYYWPFQLTAFPRNGKIVGLRLLENSKSNDWRTIAEFFTSNPDPGPHKQWKPESIPTIKTVGNLAVELVDLQLRQRQHYPTPATLAVFKFTEDGKATDAWGPGPVTISEANGNHYRSHANMIGETNLGMMWELNNALNPQEPWKLSVGFIRTKGFSSEEVHEFEHLPVQTQGKHDSVVWTNAFHTETELTFGEGSIEVQPNLKDCWIKILKVVGDSGKVYEDKWPGGANGIAWLLPEGVLKGSKTFNLTVAVTKPVYVEFIAKPTLITNAASPGFNQKR